MLRAGRLFLPVLAVFCIAGGFGGRPASAQTVIKASGVSEAAASRSAQAFARGCSNCDAAHLSAGAFGPALKGPLFESRSAVGGSSD